MAKFVEVAVALPIDRLFHYAVPGPLSETVAVGKRVRIPFANRLEIGYIIRLVENAAVDKIKDIESVIDDTPILDQRMLDLTRWIADSYFCSWGEAIAAVIPSGLKKGKREIHERKTKGIGESAAPVESSLPFTLNGEQTSALAEVNASLDKGEHKVFLLHGITASGKTEVYLQAIDRVLAKGKGAIVLVPEISLTPQTVERFVARFGERVAVTHSALTGGRRFAEWKRIRDGAASIVVGARSAVFSPLADLGLVIIDEEHDPSYKQDDVPRYHARDVAEERARIAGCPLILGSATPSLESYYKAKNGVYRLLELTTRIEDARLPKVKIVDMRMELETRKHITVFSQLLLNAIGDNLNAGNKVMIFLNRRGFSTFINCKRCGFVVKCKRCDTAMVYHFKEKVLVCHYCNSRQRPPDICPTCKSGYIRYFGLGTEKVESEMNRVFPNARIARMDSDTTSKRGSHEKILGDFKSGVTNMLVGTQMITKGHDFPEVTLVGVVSADVSLNLPDFRAGERTFNLLTQVAGRSGRAAQAGEVIVQTYAPHHYAIIAASKHDYDKFYEQEIVSRRDLHYPPFCILAKITVRARKEDVASKAADELASVIRNVAKVPPLLAGPAPAPIQRMRGYFRENILLKGSDRKELTLLIKEALLAYRKPHGVLVAVDIDPLSL